jgi:universal stress protein F
MALVVRGLAGSQAHKGGFYMYRNILVPVAPDHKQNTAKAVEIARVLRSNGGTITLLTVIEQVPGYLLQYMPEGQEEKNRAEAEVELKADAGGAKDLKVRAVTGHAGNSITDYAAEMAVDCIVIASHRPGLKDFFLGSTAARVVRYAACAVHVVR